MTGTERYRKAPLHERRTPQGGAWRKSRQPGWEAKARLLLDLIAIFFVRAVATYRSRLGVTQAGSWHVGTSEFFNYECSTVLTNDASRAAAVAPKPTQASAAATRMQASTRRFAPSARVAQA